MSLFASVIITTYNRPDYLSEALSSVLAQEYKPSQLLIINDGSDTQYDNEYNHLVSGINFDNKQYTKLPRKMGANFARNYAMKQATGDFVAFLDDDDKWKPHFLMEHFTCYQTDKSTAVILSGFQIMGQNTDKISHHKILDEDSLKPNNQFCGMSGVSAKKAVLLNIPFDESLANGQDWDLYVRLVQTKQQVRYLDKALFEYRENTPNSISTALKKMTIDQSEARLASSYKHREWLGEYYFKYRVADQLLAFIQHKPDKLKWLNKSIKIAGWRITFSILFGKVLRK